MTNILVTGGAGMLGREVVSILVKKGYTARIMSRRAQSSHLQEGTQWARADLESGQGVDEAVQGVDVIVHAATSVVRHTRQIDVDGTRLLLAMAREGGVSHVIYISIVGIDRIPLPYYRHKLAAEEVVKSSGVPWSILRATQFHYLIDLFLQAIAKLPLIMLMPTDLQCQPIDAREVAARLSEVVSAGPSGRLPDLGGPEVLTGGELAATWLAQREMQRPLIHLPLPGKVAAGFRHGYNTCPGEQRRGTITWKEWLTAKYPAQNLQGRVSDHS